MIFYVFPPRGPGHWRPAAGGPGRAAAARLSAISADHRDVTVSSQGNRLQGPRAGGLAVAAPALRAWDVADSNNRHAATNSCCYVFGIDSCHFLAEKSVYFFNGLEELLDTPLELSIGGMIFQTTAPVISAGLQLSPVPRKIVSEQMEPTTPSLSQRRYSQHCR